MEHDCLVYPYSEFHGQRECRPQHSNADHWNSVIFSACLQDADSVPAVLAGINKRGEHAGVHPTPLAPHGELVIGWVTAFRAESWLSTAFYRFLVFFYKRDEEEQRKPKTLQANDRALAQACTSTFLIPACNPGFSGRRTMG